MTPRTQAHRVHAYVSREAHDAWNAYADENGVSVSAMVEALGRLRLLSDPTLIAAARSIDQERRARSHRSRARRAPPPSVVGCECARPPTDYAIPGDHHAPDCPKYRSPT